MIYKDKYYSALNDGHICTDGNWYPNEICHKDYYTDKWISNEQESVVFLKDEGCFADSESDRFEGYFCEHCGNWYTDGIVTSDTQQFFCQDCADENCYECKDCNRWFEDCRNIINDSEDAVLCETCYECGYTICEECGCFVDYDEVVISGDSYYCPDCADEIGCNIQHYHSSMDYTPLVTEKQTEISKNDLKLFGFEIEVECDKELAEYTLELLNGYAVLQYDSSVDGFEIITRPMTREFFYNVFVNQLEKALDYLKENGALAHNKGGIHIHFSKNNINTSLLDSNLLELISCAQGTERDSKKFEIIRELSQRKASDLLQWSSPYDNSSRYGALHYDERTNTYEMRIFNSNLRIERVIKNFEVLLSMIEYSETFEKDSMTMQQYLEWVTQAKDKYECLKCFIKEKNIDRYIKNDNWLDIFSKESEAQYCVL